MKISSHFSSSQKEGKSRYEILLVYYLKSDFAAATFDFFRLDALVTLRFANTLRESLIKRI